MQRKTPHLTKSHRKTQPDIMRTSLDNANGDVKEARSALKSASEVKERQTANVNAHSNASLFCRHGEGGLFTQRKA